MPTKKSPFQQAETWIILLAFQRSGTHYLTQAGHVARSHCSHPIFWDGHSLNLFLVNFLKNQVGSAVCSDVHLCPNSIFLLGAEQTSLHVRGRGC